MDILPKMAAAALAAACMAMPAQSASSFDRDALLDRGEVYLVALHDAMRAELAECHSRPCTAFISGRLRALENGAEVYTLPIAIEPETAKPIDAAVDAAYRETFSLIMSEAADREPEAVAQVQVSYETWVAAVVDEQGEAVMAQREDDWREAMDFFWRHEPDFEPALMSFNAR